MEIFSMNEFFYRKVYFVTIKKMREMKFKLI